MKYNLLLNTSKEVKKKISNGMDTIVISIGAIEQHGSYCPLGTDIFASELISYKIAEKLECFVVFPINIGMSLHHMDYEGTISLKPETLVSVIEEVICSLIKHNFKKFIILNGHGGNNSSIGIATRNIKTYYEDVLITFSNYWNALKNIYKELLPEENNDISFREFASHGGIMETSLALLYNEESVIEDNIRSDEMNKIILAEEDTLKAIVDINDITSNGTFGNPEGFSKKLAEKLVEKCSDAIVKKYKVLVREFYNKE